MPQQINLITETKKGKLIKQPAVIEVVDGRIWFLKSPFSLKDEIKAMQDSKWHGWGENPRKVWSVADSPRNRFQLDYLQGNNPYAWFDQPIKEREYQRPLRLHQKEMADHALTYHFCIWAAEMGVGKTLSAFEVMEQSGARPWYWVGPLRTLEAIKREFIKWDFDPEFPVQLMTYDKLVSMMDAWPGGDPPKGVVFDESTALKSYTSQRTKAARTLADMIRSHYGYDGFVILMSGTPSPKTPCDWWSQCEVAFPGFLKEGSEKAMEQRLAFMTQKEFNAGIFNDRLGWKDDENKCAECGLSYDNGPHDNELYYDDYHQFRKSVNEVALLHERLNGLALVKHKKDCLDLPDKLYRTIICKPNNSTLRVAKVIAGSSPNAMQCLTMLRELSDGFLYRDVQEGEKACGHCGGTKEVQEWFDPSDPDRKYSAIDMLKPEVVASLVQTTVPCPNCGGTGKVPNMVRTAQEIPTPKETALIDLLDECDDHGRIVIFAGFTGSVDRCVNICQRNRWDVVRCDGRGFNVYQAQSDGETKKLTGADPLAHWADTKNRRVAFVAHPESGGLGLTLTEANMAVFWSNSWKPQYRIQSEDRIHRDGMDVNRGATIVDLIHLPSDERVLEVIRDNRRIELMTMGEVAQLFADIEEAA
jgi:SNF2 family DNA or RNA helicase